MREKDKPSRTQILTERDGILNHQHTVRQMLGAVSRLIVLRGKRHDRSKLRNDELPYFAKAAELKTVKYGSKEYYRIKESILGPACTKHYERNRHHPEHFENGIEDMNMLDLIEMLVDWNAACLRHDDPEEHNIFKSINHNRMRFKIKKDRAQLLWITAVDILGEEPEEGYSMTLIAECTSCAEWQDMENSVCTECSCSLREV